MRASNARARAAAGVLLGLLALAACGGRSDGGPGGDGTYRLMGEGLCQSTARAEEGDWAGARRAFFDSAHTPIHQLAAAAAEFDRAAAARLLEAKQAVEQDLADRTPALVADLGALAAAASDALRAVGESPFGCGGKP